MTQPQDVLWRRTKLGLFTTEQEQENLQRYLSKSSRAAARSKRLTALPCRSELAREKPENAAFIQPKRGVFAFFASKLAPPGYSVFRTSSCALFGFAGPAIKNIAETKI